jgi:hypothetical protein
MDRAKKLQENIKITSPSGAVAILGARWVICHVALSGTARASHDSGITGPSAGITAMIYSIDSAVGSTVAHLGCVAQRKLCSVLNMRLSDP